MSDILADLRHILEEDELDLNKKITDFSNWDSLTRLSLIAYLEENHKIIIDNSKFEEFNNLSEFIEYVNYSKK